MGLPRSETKGGWMVWVGSVGDNSAYIFAERNPSHISFDVHIEDDDGEVVFSAERDGGGVHDLEVFGEDFVVGEFGVEDGVRVIDGVCAINAVDFGGFADDFGVDFHGAQACGLFLGVVWRVGGCTARRSLAWRWRRGRVF